MDGCSLWLELSENLNTFNLPCYIGGDFNVLLYESKKWGGPVNAYACSQFRNFIREVNLLDLSLDGAKFTWSKGRSEASMGRLDRFLVSLDWFEYV